MALARKTKTMSVNITKPSFSQEKLLKSETALLVRNFMHRFIMVFMSLVIAACALPQTGRQKMTRGRINA